MKKPNNEIKHTAHSSYRCQYHIVFAPKYRRKEIYRQLRRDIGGILRELCEQKGVEIIEEYIRNQLDEDYSSDQISMKEYMDPFTGSKKK